MLSGIRLIDWITIAAIIVGPILAVQAQRFLESLRDRRSRRLAVFRDLMSTRAARVAPVHVQALNMIDIEFYGRRVFGTRVQTPSEKAVTNAWQVYSDHLNSRVFPDNEIIRWSDEGDKLLAKLLFELSKALGYDFDEVELRRNVYAPVAHGKLEQQNAAIRAGLEKLLTNQQAVAVVVYPPPPTKTDAAAPQTTSQLASAVAATDATPTTPAKTSGPEQAKV